MFSENPCWQGIFDPSLLQSRCRGKQGRKNALNGAYYLFRRYSDVIPTHEIAPRRLSRAGRCVCRFTGTHAGTNQAPIRKPLPGKALLAVVLGLQIRYPPVRIRAAPL
jgi:hypothetical protein